MRRRPKSKKSRSKSVPVALPPGRGSRANEDEGKQAEVQVPQETARTLEEKIFDAKDATLRLWERNRHLQERVEGLENRVRWLTWLILGLFLGSVSLIAVIAKG